MFGWRGQFLRVNLTSAVVRKEPLEPAVARNYLGGRGLGAYLHDNKETGDDLIFTTGPLTGTLAPNGGRYTVTAKAPSAGELAAASISGQWGAELKFAGYDGIVFEGSSPKPVYLWINNDTVELRSASHTSGKRVSETMQMLLEETDPLAVISCIGPAGENRAGCPVIVTDSYSAAGGATAAVMGSKNLKGVVVRGTGGFRVADYPGFLKSATELRSLMRSRAIAAKGTRQGDSVLVADSIVWDAVPGGSKAARTRGCFGCATSFSSFESGADPELLPLPANIPSFEMSERLRQYRSFIDWGLDFRCANSVLNSPGKDAEGNREEIIRKLASGSLQAMPVNSHAGECIERGPCMVAGYVIFPRLANQDGDSRELMAVLDSAGLCPFLCGGIGMEKISELLSLGTGVQFSQQDIFQIAKRVLAGSACVGPNAES